MSSDARTTQTPENQPGYSAWDAYLASLDDDSIDKLTVEGIDAARAWFGIGGAWTAEPIRVELSLARKEIEQLKVLYNNGHKEIERRDAEPAKYTEKQWVDMRKYFQESREQERSWRLEAEKKLAERDAEIERLRAELLSSLEGLQAECGPDDARSARMAELRKD